MTDIAMLPLAGMNNVAENEAMRNAQTGRLFLRDAVNFDITPSGRATLRKGDRRVSASAYREVWQSPLHGDVFGRLDSQWVKINPADWSHEVLAELGARVSHVVLNNLVCAAGPNGLFTYDGVQASRLTIDTPPAPMVASGAGSLEAGTYGVAVAWLRGQVESAVSEMRSIAVEQHGSLETTLPMCFDPSVTTVRLYLTRKNGGELLRAGDYPANLPRLDIPLLPSLGAPAAFRHMSPMPGGDFLAYWRGRLLTARANVLRWSEAMAYHLHDERHGFVQMPQRITFVAPVEQGIWVGQRDHVVFLRGTSPAELVAERKDSQSPVYGSAVLVTSDALSAELSQGVAAAVWLAENGYVAGTASGSVVELHAGVLRGISGVSGTSVVFARRMLTSVS